MRKRTTSLALAAFLLTLATTGMAQETAAQETGTQEEDRTVTGAKPYHGLLQYRAKDAKLALVHPEFVTAQEAGLPDGVSVVGVAIEGEARAYPLYVLKNHQVVNDRIGTVPIAASW